MSPSTSSALPLAGRVALVTGVSRRIGVGAGIARRLRADGARVLAMGFPAHDDEMPWGRDPGGRAGLIQDLGGEGDDFAYEDRFDLEDPAAPDAAIAATCERFGEIDIVVANHARSSHQGLRDVTPLELDRCWAANARASVLLAQSLGRRRSARPGGRLILFTSGQHLAPMPDEIAYAVSKGAIHQMTASLSDALVEQGVTVNAINPGPVDTGWARGDSHRKIAAGFPAGRWGTPEDVARLVAWLASDEAGWMTGNVLDHEGGFRRCPPEAIDRGDA